MKTAGIVCAFVALLIVIVFASDIRDAANVYLAGHGHPRRVDIAVHGCATVNGVLYCVDTKEGK